MTCFEQTAGLQPVYWHQAEPVRFQRDLEEISAFAPGLVLEPGPGGGPVSHHGLWRGQLPVWPLDRPQPEGLAAAVPTGMTVEVKYAAAYPMLPPQIYPVDPEPSVWERSQHTWHVAPDGSLCLMQTLGSWDPAWSITELLRRACAWRVEYALMKAEAIGAMTLRSIVDDASLDHMLVDLAVVPVVESEPDQDEQSR